MQAESAAAAEKAEKADQAAQASSTMGPELQAKFKAYDDNDDGMLKGEEIAKMLGAMGYEVDEAYLKGVLSSFDTDKSGAIEAAEFQAFFEFFKANATQPEGLVDLSEDMQARFLEADADKDGTLKGGEIKKILQAMGYAADDAYLAGVLDSFDADRSGGIEAAEFAAFFEFFKANAPAPAPAAVELSAEDRATFESADGNKDGVLKVDEIQAMLQGMGYNVDEEYLAGIMENFDDDKSGAIDAAEFPKLLAVFQATPFGS